MKESRQIILGMLGILISISGCSAPSPDERLAQFAQESMEQQSRQNDTIARQSEAVVQESQRLADAAGDLVAKDAEARQQLIEAQRDLTSELHSERQRIDQQKQAVEQERRELAEARHREPILAAVIQGLGILLIAVLPLVVCIYVLRQLYWTEPSGDEAMAEILLSELLSERPTLALGTDFTPLRLNRPDTTGEESFPTAPGEDS